MSSLMFVLGAGATLALLWLVSLVRWVVERARRPINCFNGVVWPVVDDPRWQLDHGWLMLGEIRCYTEPYIFNLEFKGVRIRTVASVRYCEAVKEATLARLALEQIEKAT